MPFVIRCPYDKCGKYMLLEDSQRGSTVACLCCKQPIKLDPSRAGDSPAAAKGAAPGAASAPSPAAPRENVRTCTRCNTPLKIPLGAENQRIRCPNCNNVF